MINIKWWLRIVGAFYLVLALMSCWVLFMDPGFFGAMFPFAAAPLSVRAFSDAWLIFVLEMGVLGAIMLALADDPQRNRVLVLIVSILELVRGAGGDLLWMWRGWPTANYIPFLLVHLLISVTGLFLLRQADLTRAES